MYVAITNDPMALFEARIPHYLLRYASPMPGTPMAQREVSRWQLGNCREAIDRQEAIGNWNHGVPKGSAVWRVPVPFWRATVAISNGIMGGVQKNGENVYIVFSRGKTNSIQLTLIATYIQEIQAAYITNLTPLPQHIGVSRARCPGASWRCLTSPPPWC
jgi:hypothetical protein